MSQVLDGKKLAKDIQDQVAAGIRSLDNQLTPTLAIVVASDDAGIAWYIRSIKKAAEACGISCDIVDLGPQATTQQLAEALTKLAKDPATHGVILQTPLPEAVKIDELLGLIPAEKDIDGISPASTGRLVSGLPCFAPATAEAVLVLLQHYEIPLEGKHAVVVGRSRVVGKPVAHLLLDANATVTICHSRTADLAAYTRNADVLVVAAGKPDLITSEHVGPQSIVIDVGTTVNAEGKLVGDVDPDIDERVKALTPVPGGVGPVTTALLLQHTLAAAKHLFKV